MKKSGVYRRADGRAWVMVARGGRGAEDQWQPRTNDFELWDLMAEQNFGWSTDKTAQQCKLDAFAKDLGLVEVPLQTVLETYRFWEYPGATQ